MSHHETRTISKVERLTVLMYGLLVFVIGGGIGVYFPLIVDRSISAESLATYAIAALAPLVADIFIPENYWKELSILGRMKLGVISAMGLVFGVGALFRNEKSFDMTFAVVATIFIFYLLYRICILSGKFQPEAVPKTEDGGTEPDIGKLQGTGLS